MYLKEYVRAIEHFKELRPFADAESEPEIQFYIAQSYKEMGNFERATAEYLKVKYLTKPTKLPWQVTALFEASKCLISLGEIAQAKVILKRIISEEGTASNFGRFAVQKLEELEKDDSK
jgi:tetratricopeptide (TPR) repeat protein